MRLSLVLAPLLLTACAGSIEPTPLTEKQAITLDRELAGKVAGEPVSCISRFPQTDMIAVSDEVLLYRVSSRLVYRNDVNGRCSGVTRGSTMVTRSSNGAQMCSGDIAQMVDLPSGTFSGSCALGRFTPYRTPGN